MAGESADCIYGFTVKNIDGETVNLGDLCGGNVCIVVNVATQ